jgi:O-antigen/teichoic acid export membrane protein
MNKAMDEKKKEVGAKHNEFEIGQFKSGLKRSAIRGGGITFLSRLTDHSVQMVCSIILARILAPSDFGLVAMVVSIAGVFAIFRDFGLTDATIQQSDINHRQVSTLFWINLGFSVMVAGLIAGMSPVIAWFYDDPRLQNVAILWSTIFIFGGLSTLPLALLKRRMLFSITSGLVVGASLTSNVAAVVLALRGWGYWAIVMRPVIRDLAILAGAFTFCRWRPGFFFCLSEVRSLIAFGGKTVGYFLANYFSRSLDRVLIGWRYGEIEVGYYHKAYYMLAMPSVELTQSLQSVAVSTLSKLREDPERFKRYYINALSGIALVAFWVCPFIAVSARDIVELLLGAKWWKAGEILAILTVAAIGICLPFGSKAVAVGYISSVCGLAWPGFSYAGKPVGLSLRSVLSAVWRYMCAGSLAGIVCWRIFAAPFIVSGTVSRISIGFVLFNACYLFTIIALFGGLGPVGKFASLIREMTPSLRRKAF